MSLGRRPGRADHHPVGVDLPAALTVTSDDLRPAPQVVVMVDLVLAGPADPEGGDQVGSGLPLAYRVSEQPQPAEAGAARPRRQL